MCFNIHFPNKRYSNNSISMDPRDGHETLRLLLQPPRSLCASTHHYPHLPSWEPVQPATARVLWSRHNFPGRTHGTSGWCNVMQASATAGSPRILYPSLPQVWVSHSARSSWSFNPVLSERRTDALRWPTRRGRSKSKAEPRELYEQRIEREISPSSLRSSGLNLHNQLDVPCICGIPE